MRNIVNLVGHFGTKYDAQIQYRRNRMPKIVQYIQKTNNCKNWNEKDFEKPYGNLRQIC